MAYHNRSSGGGKKTLVHYTDHHSASKIFQEGRIRESNNYGPARDAVIGQGVYGTAMRPGKHPVETIARNNWDDNTLPDRKMEAGKMDVAIEFQADKSRLSQVPGRSVYCHDGDVPLSDVTDVKVMDSYGRYRSVDY